jgi:hypothetical protein
MVLLIYAEKALTKSSTFHDKTSEETRNRKNVPQYNKDYIG